MTGCWTLILNYTFFHQTSTAVQHGIQPGPTVQIYRTQQKRTLTKSRTPSRATFIHTRVNQIVVSVGITLNGWRRRSISKTTCLQHLTNVVLIGTQDQVTVVRWGRTMAFKKDHIGSLTWHFIRIGKGVGAISGMITHYGWQIQQKLTRISSTVDCHAVKHGTATKCWNAKRISLRLIMAARLMGNKNRANGILH